MSKIDLSVPTRQSVKGLVLIFIQGLQQSFRMFWPMILIIVFQNKIFENKLLWVLGGILILILLIAHSILFYLNFYFYLSNGEFILKKGYLKKKTLTIPFDRIQSVNTRQNLIQQVLDVVTLEIDTAGTAAKELKIHALEKSLAIEIQNQLRSEKTKKTDAVSGEETETKSESGKLVLNLSPSDLLKIGISQNHLRTALIILAFGFQILQKAEDLFKEKAETYSNEMFEYLSSSSWALVLFLLIFFLLVSILYSLLSTVVKYFDFKLFRIEDTYRIEAGLINKRNVIVPHNKVQQLNWETGPIKQLFGIYHLILKQAVSGQNIKAKAVDAPGCLNEHLKQLKTDLFGEDLISELPKIYSNRYYFWKIWIIFAWTPVAIASPFLYSEWLFWLGVLIWLLICGGYTLLLLNKLYFQINNKQILISSGAITHKWKQMELYKIQSVEFKQNIFQKRRSIASLQLMNASGTLTIPYINDTLAKEIYNYLLYHTEISEKSWM